MAQPTLATQIRFDFPYVGNQVVDRLFEAQVHVCKKLERPVAMERLAAEFVEQGRTPYIIRVGGSNYLGAIAYAKGFQELLEQASQSGSRFERLVVATSSGGIKAGLVVGAKLAGWRGEILGIASIRCQMQTNPTMTLST